MPRDWTWGRTEGKEEEERHFNSSTCAGYMGITCAGYMGIALSMRMQGQKGKNQTLGRQCKTAQHLQNTPTLPRGLPGLGCQTLLERPQHGFRVVEELESDASNEVQHARVQQIGRGKCLFADENYSSRIYGLELQGMQNALTGKAIPRTTETEARAWVHSKQNKLFAWDPKIRWRLGHRRVQRQSHGVPVFGWTLCLPAAQVRAQLEKQSYASHLTAGAAMSVVRRNSCALLALTWTHKGVLISCPATDEHGGWSGRTREVPFGVWNKVSNSVEPRSGLYGERGSGSGEICGSITPALVVLHVPMPGLWNIESAVETLRPRVCLDLGLVSGSPASPPSSLNSPHSDSMASGLVPWNERTRTKRMTWGERPQRVAGVWTGSETRWNPDLCNAEGGCTSVE